MEKTRKKVRKNINQVVISGTLGFIIGVLVFMLMAFSAMPALMLKTKESKLGFNETVESLQASIEENGWVISTVMDMNKSMSKHGVEFGPRVKLIKLCKPDYAKSVLASNRDVSVMMPCTFSVWESDDGKVYLSRMNMSLMAKMFGGNVAKVMGGKVVKDEEKILMGILKD